LNRFMINTNKIEALKKLVADLAAKIRKIEAAAGFPGGDPVRLKALVADWKSAEAALRAAS